VTKSSSRDGEVIDILLQPRRDRPPPRGACASCSSGAAVSRTASSPQATPSNTRAHRITNDQSQRVEEPTARMRRHGKVSSTNPRSIEAGKVLSRGQAPGIDRVQLGRDRKGLLFFFGFVEVRRYVGTHLRTRRFVRLQTR